MTADLAFAGMWLGVLAAALAGCIVLHGLGLASTYVRDLLHVGAGVWILGWPHWHRGALPIAIVALVALATTVLPIIAGKSRIAARVVHSVTNGDEHWTGLVHYTVMYALLTTIAQVSDPLPAAAALLALSLGDGIGGAVGRTLGRHHYQLPDAKQKSLEGSFAVFVAASAGVAIAAHVLGRDVGILAVLGLGAIASLSEAFAPRGTDNLLIPIAVWTAATLVT
jgi:dolichol kinase